MKSLLIFILSFLLVVPFLAMVVAGFLGAIAFAGIKVGADLASGLADWITQ